MAQCELCGDHGTDTHHTQYWPEETMQVCHQCHMRIHFRDGFHDELQPERSRPNNYETTKARIERIEARSNLVCQHCSETFPLAELYPVDGGFQSMRRALQRTGYDIRDVEKRWWCFRCMGKHGPPPEAED